MKEKEKVARPGRLELPTLCLEGRRSIQLSYGRTSFIDFKSFSGRYNTILAASSLCRRGRRSTKLSLSVKNRLDEVKFRCFPVKRTWRRQECSPRRSRGERTVYLSCSTKQFPPSCCFASRRQRSNETDAVRPVQRKLLAAGPANHTGRSRNRHGGDWLPGRPQGEGFRNPESGFCDRCGDVLRV